MPLPGIHYISLHFFSLKLILYCNFHLTNIILCYKVVHTSSELKRKLTQREILDFVEILVQVKDTRQIKPKSEPSEYS